MLLCAFAFITSDGMAAVGVALFLLVNLAGPALSYQEDCDNYNVQTAWVYRNTPSTCFEAFNAIYPSNSYTADNVEHVKTVSLSSLMNL